MALRHVSGGYLQRTSDAIPQHTGSTIAGWFTRRVDRNAASCLMLLRGEGTGLYVGAYTGSGDDVALASSSYGDSGAVVSLANDAPFFAAMTFDGTNATIYGALDTASGLTSASVAITSAPDFDTIRIGDDGFGGWFDGESSGVIAWARVLSTAELNVQRRSRSPLNRADLLFWLPEIGITSAAINATDLSGAGRDFGVIGSPTATAGATRVWSLQP